MVKSKLKRRYNANARINKQVKIVDNSNDQIKIEIDKITDNNNNNDDDDNATNNDTNMLVLPSQKRKTKEIKNETNTKRVLTRKQRKHYEKVIEKKEKASKRDELLEKLSKVQINSNELSMYNSVKNIGKKEKRKLNDETTPIDAASNKTHSINSIAGSNKKMKVNGNEEKEDAESTDTDDYSTDSEIDNDQINAALEAGKKAKIVATTVQNEQTNNTNNNNTKPAVVVSRRDDDDDLDVSETTNKQTENRKSRYVHVERTEEIREFRSKLPIITEEQIIMEKIFDSEIVIICGETGSGKTTQVPQFLYEAGFGLDNMMIGITEPRRVAAINMSKRVAHEMNVTKDAIVSYQIRYEGDVAPSTRIKFMTDGVLLKEVQTDFMLSRYSVIIIDEAHERSVYTDILIGLLSRIVPLRHKKGIPLKLIIMSATLRVQDFTENTRLFKQIPPVINIESRQYPVTIHFNKHTYQDYVGEAYRKICKIHRTLPDGGILVFVTGQQEVQVLCKKLRNMFPIDSKKPRSLPNKNEFEKNKKSKLKQNIIKDKIKKLSEAPKINLDNYSSMPLDEELEMFESDDDDDNDVEFGENFDEDDDDGEEGGEEKIKKASGSSEQPLFVLPLYSLLSTEKQSKVFEKPPEGCRLCVVATNVAETSLTIPNIKYVVDTGKVKMKFYDKITGVSTFKICWTSKASADQRAGRAGRTAPGHCYRLYSSAVLNDEFKLFTEPEIARKPVEDLILQMKDLGIDYIYNFPFPTPPDEASIRVAENLLIELGALEIDRIQKKSVKHSEKVTKITNLGKTMSCFPVNPRYSKMLTLANQHNLLQYTICMISALSVQELFVDGETTIKTNQTSENKNNIEAEINVIKIKYSQIRQSWAGFGQSLLLGDLMVLLVALGAVEYEFNKNEGDATKFCQQNGIRYKAIGESRKLRKQLTNTVNSIFPNINLCMDPKLQPPSQEQAKLLRQIVLSGMVDRVAKRYNYAVKTSDGKEVKNAYQNQLLEQPIFIHPSSVLFKEMPEYICYIELTETSKIYMKGVCGIEENWIPVYLSSQCSFEKPEETPETRYDLEKDRIVCFRASTFGRLMWPMKPVEVEFPECLDKYKWFARFLLEGQICENFKKYTSVLLASPSTMLKSWARLQPRTEALLNALASENCSTKSQLLKIWSEKKDYLCKEFLLWIPESLHFELKFKWPPV